MTDSLAVVRDWLFRALLFEADSEKFRQAGYRIGADLFEVEKSLLEEAIQSFSWQFRNEGLQMARIYTQLYCFENAVRELIKDRLQEKYGTDWWSNIEVVPKKIREFAESRHKTAMEKTWLEGQKSEILAFVEFGHLAAIIIENWDDFSDLIPTQQWIKQRMDELEDARNFVAHNRLLSPSEFARIEMYISDWNKQVGF